MRKVIYSMTVSLDCFIAGPAARSGRTCRRSCFSKTLETVEGNARLVRGGVAEEVARLKGEPGEDLAVGGAGLASTFITLDLVDEYRLL